MSVRSILMWPEPWLKRKAVEVLPEEFGTPELQGLMQDLVDTMQAARGLGISAPQIGVSKRVIVIPSPNKGWLVVCNPVITAQTPNTRKEQEGCLSLPGVTLLLERHELVRVEGKGVDGQALALNLEGLSAIAAQHECEHLEGSTIADHVGPAHQHLIRAKMRKTLRHMDRAKKVVVQKRKETLELVRKAAVAQADDYAFPSKPT